MPPCCLELDPHGCFARDAWVWVNMKPPGYGPQVLVLGSINQGKPFWGYPIFDPQPPKPPFSGDSESQNPGYDLGDCLSEVQHGPATWCCFIPTSGFARRSGHVQKGGNALAWGLGKPNFDHGLHLGSLDQRNRFFFGPFPGPMRCGHGPPVGHQLTSGSNNFHSPRYGDDPWGGGQQGECTVRASHPGGGESCGLR